MTGDVKEAEVAGLRAQLGKEGHPFAGALTEAAQVEQRQRG